LDTPSAKNSICNLKDGSLLSDLFHNPSARIHQTLQVSPQKYHCPARSQTVNHINEYVDGRVHSYVDEQVFRYNSRKKSDSQRFTKMVAQVAGKRLTYAELTGKEEGAVAF
jgi:hypothetical protein